MRWRTLKPFSSVLISTQNWTEGVINISNVKALLAFDYSALNVAKVGLVSYKKSLAVEWRQYGIRAHLVAPGTVKLHAWNDWTVTNPKILEELKRWYALRDFANLPAVALATAFLASLLTLGCTRMITVVVLPVDAGLIAGNSVFAAELALEKF